MNQISYERGTRGVRSRSRPAFQTSASGRSADCRAGAPTRHDRLGCGCFATPGYMHDAVEVRIVAVVEVRPVRADGDRPIEPYASDSPAQKALVAFASRLAVSLNSIDRPTLSTARREYLLTDDPDLGLVDMPSQTSPAAMGGGPSAIFGPKFSTHRDIVARLMVNYVPPLGSLLSRWAIGNRQHPRWPARSAPLLRSVRRAAWRCRDGARGPSLRRRRRARQGRRSWPDVPPSPTRPVRAPCGYPRCGSV